MDASPKRYHPLGLFEMMRQYFVLLIAPFIRPVLHWGRDTFALAFAQELLLLCGILWYLFLLWRKRSWQLCPQANGTVLLQLHSGILLQKTASLSPAQIGAIRFGAPLFLRWLRAAHITLYYKTPTGKKDASIRLILPYGDAATLAATLAAQCSTAAHAK